MEGWLGWYCDTVLSNNMTWQFRILNLFRSYPVLKFNSCWRGKYHEYKNGNLLLKSELDLMLGHVCQDCASLVFTNKFFGLRLQLPNAAETCYWLLFKVRNEWFACELWLTSGTRANVEQNRVWPISKTFDWNLLAIQWWALVHSDASDLDVNGNIDINQSHKSGATVNLFYCFWSLQFFNF